MATTNNVKKRVVFTQREYFDTMIANGSVTVDGVTYVYSPSDTDYFVPDNTVSGSELTTALATKQDKTASVTLTDGSTTALADNTEYSGTDITTLTFTFPNEDFESYISITTASSGTIAITFPNNVKWIGEEPSYENSAQYEFSVKNGVVVAGVVE